MPLTDKAETIIWMEPVKRLDGSNWYSGRNGLLLRTRLGGPDGAIICDRVHNAVCETCRVLMSRGITGRFETWKKGVPYACMRGDIGRTAGLAEPDIGGRDCQPRFARWRAYPGSQNALPLHSVDAPAREDERVGRGGDSRRYGRLSTVGPRSQRRRAMMRAQHVARSSAGGEQLPEAAE
jgi:hypothetical protein